MDKRQIKKLDKVLLNVLAKNPAEFLLVAHHDGWIPLADLHKALMEEKIFPFLTPSALRQHFLLYKPRGLEIDQDGDMVRAIPGDAPSSLFSYPEKTPPPVLFVPIRPKAFFAVEKRGIGPQARKWLLLCASRQNALRLGKRFHNKPSIIKVMSGLAHDAGLVFHYAGAELYLTNNWIEPTFLQMPRAPVKRSEKDDNILGKQGRSGRTSSSGSKVKEALEQEQFPGSFLPSVEYFEIFSKQKERRAKRLSKKERFKKKGKRR